MTLYPQRPLVPTVMLIVRDNRGDAFAPADLYFTADNPSATPIARAVEEFIEFCDPLSWEFIKAIEINPIAAAARDVTAEFISALRHKAREAVYSEGYEYRGWISDVDDLCQEHGHRSFAPRDRDAARRSAAEAQWHTPAMEG